MSRPHGGALRTADPFEEGSGVIRRCSAEAGMCGRSMPRARSLTTPVRERGVRSPLSGNQTAKDRRPRRTTSIRDTGPKRGTRADCYRTRRGSIAYNSESTDEEDVSLRQSFDGPDKRRLSIAVVSGTPCPSRSRRSESANWRAAKTADSVYACGSLLRSSGSSQRAGRSD